MMKEEHSDTDCTIRVRYAETDQMGVAYHGNYLVWFEVGRSEFCRRHGFSYLEMEQTSQRFLRVAEVKCRYLAPLEYDKEFVVRTQLKALRRRTISFHYRLIDPEGATVYAEGETLHVVTDERGRPRSFPERYGKLLAGEKPTES
ncbi:MAG: thioesterase family protein [Acidobacteriota bacterium]